MTCPNNRSVDVQIDFNADGSAYFSWAIFIDTGEACDDSVLEYLNETYVEELYDAENEKWLARNDEAAEYWENR